MPDSWKVCTQNYTVENTPLADANTTVRHTDEWQYKTLDEEANLIPTQDF